MGLLDNIGYDQDKAFNAMTSPIALAFQNLAAHDQGGINMPVAAAQMQQLRDTRQQASQERDTRTRFSGWLQNAHPDLFQQMQLGRDVDSIQQEAFGRAQQQREQQQRQQLGTLIQDPIAQAGFLAGEMDFNTAVNYGKAEPVTPTTTQREYEQAVSEGFEGGIFDYKRQLAEAGSGGFNANQGVAAGFADRTLRANEILNNPEVIAAQTDLTQQTLSGVPVAGNFMTSEAKKQAEQAERDFINAILRRESGAVISDQEFDNARKQYLPQPGDTPAVIEQKRMNRELAIQGVVRASGPNYQPPMTIGSDGPAPIGGTTSTGLTWSVE